MDKFLSELAGEKMRIIQEIVPGKQITIAHVIANPDRELLTQVHKAQGEAVYSEMPTEAGAAIGILTITPGETAVIAADIAIKTSGVRLSKIDLTTGTLIITGSVSEVEESMRAVVLYAENKLGFEVCSITVS